MYAGISDMVFQPSAHKDHLKFIIQTYAVHMEQPGKWAGQYSLPTVNGSSSVYPASVLPGMTWTIFFDPTAGLSKKAREVQVKTSSQFLSKAKVLHILAPGVSLGAVVDWMMQQESTAKRSFTEDVELFTDRDWAKIKWLASTRTSYQRIAATASWYTGKQLKFQCQAMVLQSPLGDLASPVQVIMFMDVELLRMDPILHQYSDGNKSLPTGSSDVMGLKKTNIQVSKLYRHGLCKCEAAIIGMLRHRPNTLASAHDIRAFCVDSTVERVPVFRAEVLKLIGLNFPFLLLPRTLQDRIATSMIQSGNLALIATCKALHRHLAPTINRSGICRMTVGPGNLVMVFPTVSKEQLRNIMNVSIQVLRVQSRHTYPSDRNSGLIKLFGGADIVRNKCDVTIIGKPGETFNSSRTFLKDLGSFIGFKQVTFNMVSIPASETIAQGSTTWRNHTQDMPWNDLIVAATQLQHDLGPFLLTDTGAVFCPHNNEIRKQLLVLTSTGPYINPQRLFSYVPGQPAHGRKMAHGPMTRMPASPPIVPTARSLQPAPVPSHMISLQHEVRAEPTAAAPHGIHGQSAMTAQQTITSQPTRQHHQTQVTPPRANPQFLRQITPVLESKPRKKRERAASSNALATQTRAHKIRGGPVSSINTRDT
ncbi:MAG: hypothetical protein Q9163_002587 [Psora crenata]